MAKQSPVLHKVFNERGLRLEKAHRDQQGSNIHAGKTVVIHMPDSDGEEGKDVRIEIGQRCPICRKRVRGLNHVEGMHHRGTVSRRRQ